MPTNSTSTTFFKDENLSQFDNAINTVIDSIRSTSPGQSSSEHELTSDLIDQIISYDNKPNQSTSDIQQILSQVSVPIERTRRYNVYKEIIKTIPLVKRIIKVYISNILQKNPTTGKSLIYRRTKSSVSDEDYAQAQSHAETIINKYDLIKKLRYKIIPTLLGYGDCFIEVLDVSEEYNKILNKSKKDPTETFSLLTEVKNSLNQLSDSNISNYRNGSAQTIIDEKLDLIANFLIDEATDPAPKNNKNEINFNNVLIRIHHPEKIVKLEDSYGNLFGYLEVIHRDAEDQTTNIQQLFTKVSYLGRTTVNTQQTNEKLINKLLKKLLYKLLIKNNDSANISNKSIDSIISKLDPSVYDFLKKLLVQNSAYIKKDAVTQSKVRFIPISNMISLTLPSVDYYPYGESIVDPLVLPSKLYLLSQLANVITKLSRAALVRKWTIDVGPTQMHSSLIQKLKRELYNTRVTIDSLSTFKTISNILSDYKDMFILSKNGQKSIDVEVQAHGDPSIKIADLEDARREIMTLSGIPSVYLGAETPELREALVHANTSFATEISEIQEIINECLNQIIDKISLILYKTKTSNYCTVTLIPPIVLILQLIEMTLSSIGNIAGVFNSMQLDFDPYIFLEKYVPYEDWQEFKSKAEQYTRDKNLKMANTQANDQGY